MKSSHQRRITLWSNEELWGQLLRGGVGSLLARIAEVLLGLAVVILLARLLGAPGYGVYTFVFALASLLSVMARGGLVPLVIRETARGQQCGNWGEVKGIWRWATAISLMMSLLFASGGIIGLGLGWGQGEALRETLFWGLALIPIMTLVGIRAASLIGLRHVLAGIFPEQVLRPAILVVFLFGVLFLSENGVSPGQAMGLTVLAGTVSLFVGFWFLNRYRPSELDAATPVYRSRVWLGAAFPLLLTQGFEQINRYADVLMLGVLAATEDVGVYRVAAQGALLVSLALFALTMVVGPFAARIHAEGDIARLQTLARRTAQGALGVAVPATLLFALVGEWLLVTLFGDEFAPAYWPLLILALGQLVNTGFGPVGILLNMTGFERDVTRAVAVAAGLNVLLNLLLIPSFGVIGAAVATSASLAFWNVWLWLVAHWRLGIRCSAF
ncbi:oligosaccharide flippase family protein [Guyparkeria halophila]|uniref:Oligosaccharide flippase family protein n=1 Tax=Guyparkeria halophila TaxID=47960 RepID=A0A6I6D0P2_9GAMM|nr:flippase [Guyparkeria halophila]QGT79280.1 oligosaccharide flippase family protein [Guyparkeria halophila]